MGCRVAVGTSNEMKLRSVASAMRLLCGSVEAVAIDVHGPRPQPVGLDEVVAGAVVRAKQALEKASADYGVGVEAGPFTLAGIVIEVQAAAIIDRDLRVSVGLSQGFQLPSEWAERVVREGVELGSIAERLLSRRAIGRRQGIIAYLTQGLVSRGDLTRDAVLMALVPRLNPELYTLPRVDELLAALGQRV